MVMKKLTNGRERRKENREGGKKKERRVGKGEREERDIKEVDYPIISSLRYVCYKYFVKYTHTHS